jgi:hypothetical protein
VMVSGDVVPVAVVHEPKLFVPAPTLVANW